MRIALIQPQFAPNLHDLAAMIKADTVILQDNIRWSRKSRCHRAKIRIERGTQWINIPIITEDKGKDISEVRIDHEEDWKLPFFNALEYNYRNSVYYDYYEPEITSLIEKAEEFSKLIDFNLFFFDHLLRYLELNIDYQLASSRDDYEEDPDALIDNLELTALYQEYDARNYQRQSDRAKNALDEHPVYRQHFEGFEKDCCVLDLLFQYGPESFRIIDEL